MRDSQSAPSDAYGTGPPLSVGEAADLLGVSPATVRAHLHQGTLVGEKIENQWVVYLAGTTSSPAPAVVADAGQDRVVAATAPGGHLRRLRYTARRGRS